MPTLREHKLRLQSAIEAMLQELHQAPYTLSFETLSILREEASCVRKMLGRDRSFDLLPLEILLEDDSPACRPSHVAARCSKADLPNAGGPCGIGS